MGKVRVNNVVIECEHHQATTRKPKNCKDMEIFVRYEEWERKIKCDEQQDETKSSPYVKTKNELRGNYNPVDCEACKSELSKYLTSEVFHPNPNEVLQDMYEKVSSLRRRVANSELYGTGAVYEIVNNIERHCMSRNKERLITWVDCQKQQPQPRRAMEVVKEGGLPTEGEGFTCAICLEGVKNTGKKRKRSNDDDKEVARQEEEPDYCAINRVVRLVSCHHMFHKTCIDRWVKDCGHDTCPLCRFQLPNASRCRCNWELSKKRALDNSKTVKTDFDTLLIRSSEMYRV